MRPYRRAAGFAGGLIGSAAMAAGGGAGPVVGFPADPLSARWSPAGYGRGLGAELPAPACRAAVAACRAWEQSIWSVECDTVCSYDAPGARDWVWERARDGFDDAGRWYLCGVNYDFHDSDPVGPPVEQSVACDGQVVRAYTPAAEGGMIRPPDPEREGYASIEVLMGRLIDHRSRRTVGQMLEDALDRGELTAFQGERPEWVVLEGVTAHEGWGDGVVIRLRVTLDASRQFMPIEILTHDPIFGTPDLTIEVTETAVVEGHCVPVEGWRAWFKPEDPAPLIAGFEAAEGHPFDLTNAADRRALWLLTDKAWESRSVPLRLVDDRWFRVRGGAFRINDEFDVDEKVMFPVGTRVGDAFEDRVLEMTDDGLAPAPPKRRRSP